LGTAASAVQRSEASASRSSDAGVNGTAPDSAHYKPLKRPVVSSKSQIAKQNAQPVPLLPTRFPPRVDHSLESKIPLPWSQPLIKSTAERLSTDSIPPVNHRDSCQCKSLERSGIHSPQKKGGQPRPPIQ